MKLPVIASLPLMVAFALMTTANAATLIVSPTGTSGAACTRQAPCDLTTGATTAKAGDTVILMDGIYKTTLEVTNSGTASAWITFQADDCATPILEGDGIEGDTGDGKVDQPTGVGSGTATYVRFDGLVSRGWNTGFGNGWTGERTTTSNGNFEYKHCVADGNGRTGFTFYSAGGLHIQNCISAHNGSSEKHSWSSGITLYEAQGSNNLVEGSVSFENMDAQNHTDGSGFIVDESSNNATLINNIAFGNGGSCFRLTASSGTKFINNTCYHNAKDTADQGPDNPSEIYFTANNTPSTTEGVTVKNNVFIATGVGPGQQPVQNQPGSGWSNNITGTGTVSHFTAPEGNNPDFTLTSSATTLLGKGSSGGGAPTNDIGFDPKCIVKKAPTMIGSFPRASWWQYSVDIDYIKSIGGVAKCFRPKTRSGNPDIGAYSNGSVTPATTCVPSSTGGAPSTGGATSVGGATSAGGAPSGGTTNAGGASSTNNSSSAATGGTSAAQGGSAHGTTSSSSAIAKGGSTTVTTNASGGSDSSAASSQASADGGNPASSEASANGGNPASSQTSVKGGNSTSAQTTAGGSSNGPNTTRTSSTSVVATNPPDPGCGCRMADRSRGAATWIAFSLTSLLLVRRRQRRST